MVQYPTLRAAYSFYNVAQTVKFVDLMHDALIVAKQACFSPSLSHSLTVSLSLSLSLFTSFRVSHTHTYALSL